MLEGGAIGLGQEKVLVPVRGRPVERQRDLGGGFASQREILKLPLPNAWTCQPWAWSAACKAAGSPE